MTVVESLIQTSVDFLNSNQNLHEATADQVLGVYVSAATLLGRFLAVWNWKRWLGPTSKTVLLFGASVLVGALSLVAPRRNMVVRELLASLNHEEPIWDSTRDKGELLCGSVLYKMERGITGAGVWYLVDVLIGKDRVALTGEQCKTVGTKARKVIQSLTQEDDRRREDEQAEKIRRARELRV